MGGARMGGGFGLLMFDANNDGRVTRAEFDAGQKARFAAADANRDGFVTPEEMRASMRQRMADRRFARLDTDHNGQISKAEFEAAMPKPGAGLRPDGPGMHRGWQGERPHLARFGGPHNPRGPGLRAPGDQADARPVRRMGPADANDDGKLSLEEFSARGSAAFARADANKDGTVTIAELRTSAGAPR
jgi:Ca2+-binding EF-hand superfamily protein